MTSFGKITMYAVNVPDLDAVATADPSPGRQVSVTFRPGAKRAPLTCVVSPYEARSGVVVSRGAGTVALTGTPPLTGGCPSSCVVTTRLPAAGPTAAGLNVTLTVHRLPAASSTPAHRSPLTRNGPVAVTPVTVPGPGPVSVTVTVTARAPLSTSTAPKPTAPGDPVSLGRRSKV